MKLTKTIKIKIGELSKNKQNIIGILLRKNTKAINFCLNKAKEGKTITHKLVYQDLRKLNLPATVIHGSRAKSVEIIKSYKKVKKKKSKFPELKKSSVRYDNINAKLRKTDNKIYKYFISLLYNAGTRGKNSKRLELPLITNSIYQKEIMQQIGDTYKLGAVELVKKRKDYFIHISYSKKVELPVPDKSFSPIGIDVGINNLAVSVAQSSVEFHNGERISYKNEFFRRERARLQANFALQEIKRLRGKQTKYNNHYINEISKRIVEQAKKEIKPVIVMEDLTHIRDTAKVSKKQKYKHHSWVFKRLQKAIEYKAMWGGIPTVYIDPYHTSQICSKCGELNKRKKHTYKCKSCGFEANADYNAGRNIQNLFRAKCSGEKAPINCASNPNNQEPKAKRDIRVRNISIPPTTEVMGILEVIL